jgi:hypothetical protein
MALWSNYLTKSICVLGERWPVEPFNGNFHDPVDPSVIISYTVEFHCRALAITPDRNFTVINFVHQFTQKHSIGVGRENPGFEAEDVILHGQVARYVAGLVNYLIDLVQFTFEEVDDNPFPHIRRVGIRDFVSMDNFPIGKDGNRKGQGLSMANLAIDSQIAKRSIGIVSKVNFSFDNNNRPVERIKMLRTVELLNSGYHSEALLLSFALLDNFVQKAIMIILEDKKINQPKVFLSRIPESRLETFLGPLLKILTGHSLEEDKPDVWVNLKKNNKNRNDAMHLSKDMSYDQAKQCIETTKEILIYLHTVNSLVPNPQIDSLPFLFDV